MVQGLGLSELEAPCSSGAAFRVRCLSGFCLPRVSSYWGFNYGVQDTLLLHLGVVEETATAGQRAMLTSGGQEEQPDTALGSSSRPSPKMPRAYWQAR